jgi:hypothetical protein
VVLGSPEYQQDLVQDLYLQLLDRPVDPSGLATFTGLLAQGVRDEVVIAVIAGSAEYFNRSTPSMT